MTPEAGTPTEIDWLMEQLDACYDIAHTYTCAICEDRQGKEPVVIVQDQPEGGVRVHIIIVCKDCVPQVKGMSMDIRKAYVVTLRSHEYGIEQFKYETEEEALDGFERLEESARISSKIDRIERTVEYLGFVPVE